MLAADWRPTVPRQPVDRLAYRPSEAARALGVSVTTVQRMIREGRLVTVDTGTRRIVIPRWSLEELLQVPQPERVPLTELDEATSK
jgi:excisionase family DNA binding protein